ncbi:mRNA splicing protein [Coemansia sp. Benny D115]|nr:mRNA splicing protein [Coemansia sp. Benny D115]
MSGTGAYGSGKLSREDYKKQKDLENARKSGLAPAALDEEGNPINPHIPEFMSKAPWYMDTGKMGLQHQRKKQEDKSSDWYQRGVRVGKGSKKFKAGSCENCGAGSHKTKECMERPRKRGARWTGKDLMADEYVSDVKLDYDAKRDRWNGYDAEDHRKLMEEWEMVEEARKKRKATELDDKERRKEEGGETKRKAEDNIEAQFESSDEDGSDVERRGDEGKGAKSKSTVRNLRIREDTAKYLRNLDPDSAYYDPKTRSMRENPYASQSDKTSVAQRHGYAGDNFIRYTGEAQEVVKQEVFAWEAGERGNQSAHFQANPTQTALMYKEYKGKSESLKDEKKARILKEYGGEEHLNMPARELLVQQERYVEYTRSGKVVQPADKREEVGVVGGKSRYKEDVYPMNHHSTGLNIDLHDNHSLLRFLKEASAYFNFGGQKWTNVQLLTIKFYKDMFIDDEEEFEEDTRSHQALLSLDMANFADALIEGVPNVSRLKLSTLKFSTLGDILSNHLANAYAPQFTSSYH